MACPPVPADNLTLCRYVAYLACRLSYQSIPKYLNIIRLQHLELGLPNPMDNNYSVASILKGVKRVKGCTVTQKLPITPAIMYQIRACLDISKPCDLLFWATCLLAFFSLLRKSNLLPASPGKFSPLRHPCRGDLTLASRGLALRVKYSKTLQFRERIHLVPLPYLQGHPLCPVTALIALLCYQPRQLSHVSPLLTLPSGQLLTQAAFQARLRAILQSCGLDATSYSGHSFRRGAATTMFQAGLPGEIIQLLGDWKSDAYKLYLTVDLHSKFSFLGPWLKFLKTNF